MYNSDVLKHQDKHGSRKWGLFDLVKFALIGLILEITQSIHIMPPFMRNQTCDISQGSQSAYFPDGLIVDSFIALNTSKVLNSVNSNTNNFTKSSSWTSQCTFKFPELIPDDSSSKQPTVIESFAVSNNTDNYIWYNEECGGSALLHMEYQEVWTGKGVRFDTPPVKSVMMVYFNRTASPTEIKIRKAHIPIKHELQTESLKQKPKVVFSDRIKMHDNIGFAILANVTYGEKDAQQEATVISFVECGMMPEDISCLEKGFLQSVRPGSQSKTTYLGLYYGVSYAWVVTSDRELIKYKIGTVNQELSNYKLEEPEGRKDPILDLIRFRGDFFLVDRSGVWAISLEDTSAVILSDHYLVKLNPNRDNQWLVHSVQYSSSHIGVVVVSNNSTQEMVKVFLEHCTGANCDTDQLDIDPVATKWITDKVMSITQRMRIKYIIKNSPNSRGGFNFSDKSANYFIGYKDRLIIQGKENRPLILLQSEIKQIEDLVYLNKSNSEKRTMPFISVQGVQKFPYAQNPRFQGILPVGRNLEEDLHHLVVTRPEGDIEFAAKLIKLNVEAPSLDCTLANQTELERANNLDMMVIYRADRLLIEQIIPLQYQVKFAKLTNWQHTLTVIGISAIVLCSVVLQIRYCLRQKKEANFPKEYFPQYNINPDFTLLPETS